MKPLRIFSPAGLAVLFVAASTFLADAAEQGAIDKVDLSSASFSPALNERVTARFVLPANDRVTVEVIDGDGGLVRRVVDNQPMEAGPREVVWDGRDWEGRPVPDDAYTFLISTAAGTVFDPRAHSGGKAGDIVDAKLEPEEGTFVYTVPAAARVLVRFGIQGGPMLKTLVDWRPKVAGIITEYWDGHDENGIVNLRETKGFTVLITYVTLPDATVIAYGNTNETYRAYKLGRAKDQPVRQAPPRSNADADPVIRPEGLLPAAWARAPKVLMTFPGRNDAAGTLPRISGTAPVRIDIDPEDKAHLLKDQFEIIFYVDNVFFAEAERGYLPYNLQWETQQIPAGEHVLTVNISSFRGQVGVVSRKVVVSKP